MSDVLFYHLTETPLEHAIPPLLEKSLERGWNVAIRTSTEARCDYLDAHLWTYRQNSFLPHGRASDPHAEHQPVLISTQSANTNKADALFLVDGAQETVENLAGYARVCVFFDGNDPEAVDQTRRFWTEVKAAGAEAKYWAQDNGRWVQKA